MKKHALNLGSFILFFSILIPFALDAQYFGRNKPHYKTFDYKLYETPYFSIYHYLDNKEALDRIGLWSDQWYKMHQKIFRDSFYTKNPIILYNDHADFQQTNAISGEIGVGTGGVTEALRNRVIFPFTMTNQQTWHVLGHELVHAFQYDVVINGDSSSIKNLQNLPLWMVEGLAEYLSLGRVDPFTAMWMRDAVLQGDVPGFKQLENPRYFPYRYGQAFWAFLAGMYGDDVIRPMFVNTAIYGIETASAITLGVTADQLSERFQNALRTYYDPFLGDKKERLIGRELVSAKNGGRINVSPVLSPNGKYIIFLSEKDLFSTDLYLADATSGKIIRKVLSTTKEGHLDDLNYLESSGTWSSDSKQFATIAYKKGVHALIIKDVASGRTKEEIQFKEVPAFANPAWSPDGKSIVFAGLAQGQTDLYEYVLKSKKLKRLTNDIYSEIQPNWSTDGKSIVYATDKLSMDRGRKHGKYTMNLAILSKGADGELASGTTKDLDFFYGANNLNPEHDDDGNIYFLSDKDGFRNMYRYELSDDKVYQMTDFLSGISGITEYSPALTVSRKKDKIVYSYYSKNSFSIYSAGQDRFLNRPVVDVNAIDMAPGTLPMTNLGQKDIVADNLSKVDGYTQLPLPEDAYKLKFQAKPVVNKFKLDYIGGSTGLGVGTGSFGTRTGLAGGVQMLFSDLFGNHQIYSTLALNGDIYDFGGQVTYINSKRKIAWGTTLSHIPFQTGGVSYRLDTLNFSNGQYEVLREDLDILRIFEDQMGVFAQFPLSTTRRFETSLSGNYRSFRLDRYPTFYDPYTYQYIDQGRRERIPLETDVINIGGYLIKRTGFFNTGLAYVGDNSNFGMASPMSGHRYRFEVEKYFSGYNFAAATADYRKYWWKKPVSIAARVMYHGRFGESARGFSPILVGNMGFVHGFYYTQLDRLASENGIGFEQLSGQKLLMGNLEVRLPFTGPERLAVIKSGYLLSELSVFLDGGVAYDQFGQISFSKTGVNDFTFKRFVASTGASLRVNLFGAIIIEPYYAFPLLKGSKGAFGLNLVPGW
ncbi:MAG: PD40 domain-containing protein [Saprospiraceae bacterium]|jgi:Tol biopolymer transport system component|nr:PD40 domain-containing protein [Saprospiraceae bacterium]MBK7373079.1 PD40 domain-containing protein [Saprospiraceae bacterium]MBK8280317.1 PD40 domain-containing protein [Saprospiraceae bacterium]MBK8513217.1 PD40 domain-containing protein [Saprospiraceae bacterium]MBK9928581.1 PD40 domain-containing protein [Saprospiraceae bacterium]